MWRFRLNVYKDTLDRRFICKLSFSRCGILMESCSIPVVTFRAFWHLCRDSGPNCSSDISPTSSEILYLLTLLLALAGDRIRRRVNVPMLWLRGVCVQGGDLVRSQKRIWEKLFRPRGKENLTQRVLFWLLTLCLMLPYVSSAVKLGCCVAGDIQFTPLFASPESLHHGGNMDILPLWYGCCRCRDWALLLSHPTLLPAALPSSGWVVWRKSEYGADRISLFHLLPVPVLGVWCWYWSISLVSYK